MNWIIVPIIGFLGWNYKKHVEKIDSLEQELHEMKVENAVIKNELHNITKMLDELKQMVNLLLKRHDQYMPFKAKRTVYRPKFAKELREGLRYNNGWTIEQCCRHWGTTRQSYHNWKKDIKEFAVAAEIGEQDYYCYCIEKGWDMVEGRVKGNAAVYGLLMSSLHGMSAKTETKVTHEEQIKTININVIDKNKDNPVVIDQIPEIKLTAYQKFIEKNKAKAALIKKEEE